MDDWDITDQLQHCEDSACIEFFQQHPAFVNHELKEIINWPWTINVAASYGKTDTVKYLVAHGADLESADGIGYTALHDAASEGHFETVKYLLEQGVSVNLVKETQINAYKHGPSPLTAACLKADTEMIQMLLDNGANVNGTPPEPFVPLHAALTFKHKEVVRVLLWHGADPTLRNKEGRSALDIVEGPCSDPELMLMLREAINKKDSGG